MAKQIKGRKLFAATASAALVASAIVPVASAADLKDANSIPAWAKTEVQALVDAGVIQGDQNGNFNASGAVTRAAAAEILYKALGLTTEGTENFSDVSAGDWYYDAVVATSNAGIFEGNEKGEFKPNAPLTREQAAKVIVAAYGLTGSADLSQFADGNKVSGWAKDAVSTAVANGVIKGDGTNLNPAKSISRAEIAVMVYRVINEDIDVIGSSSVQAINATTVEVTYEEDVDNVKATSYSIDGLEVTNAVVKQGQQNVVILTTSTQEGGKVYTVKEDGTTVGTFEGISAVVPEKITLAKSSFQGVVGEEVTVTADIGQKVKNVPVTFSVDSGDDNLNRDIVQEVLTDENGIATFSYTQYNAGPTDDVFVYPTGAPAKRALAYVYWGVTESLKLESADDKGNSINNGESKLYKVTYVDPKDGKVYSNKELYVTLEENVDVTYDKLSTATVNGQKPYQLSNREEEYGVKAVKIKTNSKGEATFTVTGNNTKATPIVFVNEIEKEKDKLDARERQVKAETLVIGAEQAEYKIEVTRSGSEEATVTGSITNGVPSDRNGRVYKVTVKDNDGKAASNEVVNVSFNEIEDKDMDTKTKAKIFDYEHKGGDKDEDYLGDFLSGHGTDKVTLKLNSKGEAEFRVASEHVDDYATPIVWIDINSSDAKEGILEDGEPNVIADTTYFSEAILKNGRVRAYKAITGDTATDRVKNNRSFDAGETAFFRYEATNQSNEPILVPGVTLETEYTVFNTGSDEVEVHWEKDGVKRSEVISPNRSYTVPKLVGTASLPQQFISVKALNGKSAKVRVEASAVTKSNKSVDNDQFLGKYSETATIKGSTEIGTVYTGIIDEKLNVSDKTFRFKDRKGTLVSYRDASSFIYNNAQIDVDYFEELVNANTGTVRVTVERNADGDFDKFTIVTLGTTTTPPAKTNQEVADEVTVKINALGEVTLADETKVTAARAAYEALNAAQQALVTNLAKLEAAEAKIAELKTPGEEPVVGVEITTADAIANNSFALGLGIFEEYVVEGTVADKTVTELVLTFTDVNGVEVTETVEVVDGAFSVTYAGTDFDYTLDSVSVENGETKKFNKFKK